MGSPDGGTDDVVRGKAETSRKKKKKKNEILTYTNTKRMCDIPFLHYAKSFVYL